MLQGCGLSSRATAKPVSHGMRGAKIVYGARKRAPVANRYNAVYARTQGTRRSRGRGRQNITLPQKPYCAVVEGATD
jgi:hypothetical protein